MSEPLRIMAGDCTVTNEDADETHRERGNVVTLCKPDNCRELLVDRSEWAHWMWIAPVPDVMGERTPMMQGLIYT